MFKKKLSVILAILTAVSVLSACGGAGQDNITSSTPSAGSSVSEQAANAESTQPETESGQTEDVPSESEGTGENSEQSSKSESSGEQQSSSEKSGNSGSSDSSDNSKTSENSKSTAGQGSSQNPENSVKQESSSGNAGNKTPQTTSQPTESSKPSVPQSSQSSDQTSRTVTETSKPQTSVKESSGSGSASESTPTPAPSSSNSSIGDISLYNELFNINTKVNIQVTISKTELDKLQSDYQKYKAKNSKSPIYRKADVTITVGSKSYKIEEVGIRLKGNTSLDPFYDLNSGELNLSHYKLSFNETFDDKTYYGSDAKVWASTEERKARKNRRFATLKKLDVKWNRNYDDTHIREIYATKLFEESDVLVQKINLSQLVVNGNNYGVVNIYEPVDEIFLEKRLPSSALGGDLYKCAWTMNGCTYEKSNSIGVSDKDKGTKYNFDLKTNEKTSKNTQLKNLLNVINQSSPSKSALEGVIDTDYFAKFMAASYFAGDPDDIRNNYNNHYIYFRKDTGKAIFIPYDNDRTLGITYGYNPDGKGCSERNPYSGWAAGANNGQQNPLIKLTIIDNNNSTFNYVKDKYTAQLKVLAASDMMKSDADFNKMYNTAKNHYESVVTPSVKFKNQKQSFKFSLDGKKNSGDNANMSFEQFRSAIITTFKNKVK